MSAMLPSARDRWLGIEVRHLEALDAVARLGSFASAAHALGYVSSAISQQIDYLERLAGHRLVDRGHAGRALELTRAGEVLLAHAREVLAELGIAEHGLTAGPEQPAATLRLGSQPVLGPRVAGAVLEALAPLLGDRLAAVCHSGGDLLGALADRRVDAVVHELPVSAERYVAVEVRREPVVVAIPAGARVPAVLPCPARALAGMTLVDIHGCRATRALRAELSARGVAVDWRFRVAGAAAARALVAAGAGAAVLPAADARAWGFASLGLAGVQHVPLERREGVVWLRARDDDPALEPVRLAARRVAAATGAWPVANAA